MKLVNASLYLVITLLVSACSEQVSVETHLAAAKNYLNQNKVNESIIELKNAIRADNKNGEARFLLGTVYLNQGDGAAAAKELERAKQFNYDVNKVLPSLARAYVITDKSIDVLDLTEASNDLSDKAKNHFLAYKTLAAIQNDKLDIAQKSADLAYSLDESALYTYLSQAYLAVNEGEYDKANNLLGKIFAIDNQQVDALMLHGQLSMLTNEYELAAKSFKTYSILQPKSGIVQLLLADALLKSEQYDEAEKYADMILAQVPNQPFAHYIKAMVSFHRKDFEKASEHSEQALAANFNQPNLKLVAGASAFYLGNWQQSYHHLNEIVNYLPQDHKARHMLAVAQLELGLIDEISATLGGDDNTKIEDSEFLSVLSYKLLQLGATDEAKQLLAQNDDVTLKQADESARQGILKLMMNDPSGIQYLENAITLEPDFAGAELALAYALLERNELEKAKAIATKWHEKHPDEASSYTLLGSIALKERKFDDAEKYLSTSLTIEPDNLFTLMEQLKSAREQKNIPLSKQRADHLITVAPDNNMALRHYFGVYHNEMALKKLQDSYQSNPLDVNKAILLAEGMVSLSHYKKAEEVLLNIAESSKLPKRYWQLLIAIYQKQNDSKNLQLTLEKWMKVSPYHIEPIALLANFHASYGDRKQALKVVKRGLNYHENNLILQLIEMQLLLDDKQVIPAKKLYESLKTSEINPALKQGMQGRIYLLEKNYKQALPMLITLYEAYPNSQNVEYVAYAYLGNNEEQKAIEILERHVAIDNNAHKIKTFLAGLYLKNDTNKAIATYEELISKQPNNVIARNNLAWLYLDNNEIEKALIHIKKAYEIAPQVPNICDTYGKVLLKSGDKRGALKYLGQALELSKGKDISIKLNYIEALIANSRINEARELLTDISPSTEAQTEMKAALQSKL